jgi:hypothetical protein
VNPAVVEEVLRFEELPVGSMASRRAVVRWSDGSESEALRYYNDEILSPAHWADGA